MHPDRHIRSRTHVCMHIRVSVYVGVCVCTLRARVNIHTTAFMRSRGRARLRRWRHVTSVPLLSDRAIEKFPRFFARGGLGGANRTLIGPAVWSSLRAAGTRGGERTRSPSFSFSLSLALRTLARYLSRLQILTSYRYRGHSSILYSPYRPLPPLHCIRSFVSLSHPMDFTVRAFSCKFRLMNYMYNI